MSTEKHNVSIRTEERAEDLGLFYQKIILMMDKKGLDVFDALDVFTFAVCDIAMNHDFSLENALSEINRVWARLSELKAKQRNKKDE